MPAPPVVEVATQQAADLKPGAELGQEHAIATLAVQDAGDVGLGGEVYRRVDEVVQPAAADHADLAEAPAEREQRRVQRAADAVPPRALVDVDVGEIEGVAGRIVARERATVRHAHPRVGREWIDRGRQHQRRDRADDPAGILDEQLALGEPRVVHAQVRGLEHDAVLDEVRVRGAVERGEGVEIGGGDLANREAHRDRVWRARRAAKAPAREFTPAPCCRRTAVTVVTVPPWARVGRRVGECRLRRPREAGASPHRGELPD